MANLWQDGCEIDFADNAAGLWTGFTENSSSLGDLAWVNTKARTGSGSVRIYSTSNGISRYIYKTLPSTYTEVFVGVGVLWDSGSAFTEGHNGAGVQFLSLVSSASNIQITMAIDTSTNVIRLYRGQINDNNLLGSGTTPITADIFHYIELNATINDTTGAATVKVDGITDITLTGIDTNTGTANVGTIRMGVLPSGNITFGGAAADFYFDDVVVNDTSGTVANSWPNQAGVQLLTPNADGNYTAWTSTGGAVDYTEVDDVAAWGGLPDGDTTHLSSATTGQRTSVGLTGVTGAGDVLGVMLLTNAASSVATADTMNQFVRVNGTDYDSTAFSPGTSYAWRTDILTLNPDTSAAWTTAEIETMELGWQRVT